MPEWGSASREARRVALSSDAPACGEPNIDNTCAFAPATPSPYYHSAWRTQQCWKTLRVFLKSLASRLYPMACPKTVLAMSVQLVYGVV